MANWVVRSRAGHGRGTPIIIVVLLVTAAAWLIDSLATSAPLGGQRYAAPAPVDSAASSPSPVLGIIGVSTSYLAKVKSAGVGAVTIGIGWASAEPRQGTFSSGYLGYIEREVDAARVRGLLVVLDPGLQYAPNWVFALPGGTRFVNQYGDRFGGTAGSGNEVPNAVTDLAVRSAEATYLSWLGSRFRPGEIMAVREGGGPLGELRYPNADYQGHANSYWAYDASTQAISPVRGWLPGTGTVGQARAFLAAYNADLDRFGRWLDGQLQADFRTEVLVMLPGWGERPGGATNEVATLLTLDLPEFNEGLDWTDLLDALPDPAHSIAYSTYLDASTVEPTQQLEDPMDYIASIVAGTPVGLGGENTGNGTLADLGLCIQRARRLHLSIVQWMDGDQLIASGSGRDAKGPTLSELGADWRAAMTTAPRTD